MTGKSQPLVSNQPIVKTDGTPTDYFIRWAQERQLDISAGITGEQAIQLVSDALTNRHVLAGSGLTGGGDLSQDRTISLAAGLDDLNDVDLSTPPTDGQALAFSQGQGKWVPETISGGGGGGGTVSPPTMVQFATLRNDGTIYLPNPPTAGNMLVFVAAGYQVSILGYLPSGFQLHSNYASDPNNGVQLAFRRAQSGDTGSYNVSAGDNQACVLYEFSGVGGILGVLGGAIANAFNGAALALNYPGCPFGAVPLIALEQDNTNDWNIDAQPNLSVDFIGSSSGGNHTSTFLRLTDAFSQTITGTMTGNPSSPVVGMWFIIGKTAGAASSAMTAMVNKLISRSMSSAYLPMDQPVKEATPVVISRADGNLLAADAAQYPLAFVIGFAETDAAKGDTINAISLGNITLDDWTPVAGTQYLSPGCPYFLKEGGGITLTRPTKSGSAVVFLGLATSQNSLNAQIATPILL